MSTINVLDATGATVAINTPNADGQDVMANSRSVVIASDQTPVPIFEADAVVTPVTSLSATGILFSVNASDYRTAVLQLTGTFVGTVTFEVSNDNTNWVSAIAYQPGNTGSAAPATTATVVGIYIIPVTAHYVRARVSTYTSGTFGGTAILRNEPARAVGVNAVLSGTLPAIAGQAAHDAVLAGTPVRIGARAVTANYTAVATGDAADLISTLVGVQIIRPFSIPELDWQSTQALTTTTAAPARAAGAAGIRNYVTGAQFSNSGASAIDVIILDGATEIWRATVAANGYVSAAFQSPLRGTAATALNVNLSAVGTVRANVQGYQAP